MIAALDNLLRHLFLARVSGLKKAAQIGFQPPNADWVTYVHGLNALALNVYLVAFSENLQLRSNERTRDLTGRLVNEIRDPRRLDCHYMITAWSPATANPPLVEPALDEHNLLHRVATALVDAEPMVARAIYAPSPLPKGFPEELADVELPSIFLWAQGFPATVDLWNTMSQPWRPALHLTVTLPLLYTSQAAGEMVTTTITEYRRSGGGEAEVWIQIGGQVLAGKPPLPVVAASVGLETPGGLPLQTADSDADGRFVFAKLATGSYMLRVRAAGFAETKRSIDVPSPTGEYDVKLS